MDVNEQRSGLIGLRPPEINHLHPVGAIRDVLVRLDGKLILPVLGCGLLRLGRCIGACQNRQWREQQGSEEEGGFH